MKRNRSEEGRDRYEALARALSSRGADAASMFGMPVLKAGGKVFAGFYDGCMTFKLPQGPRERALTVAGAQPFDPGMGRMMREWVQVPAQQADEWERLAADALEYARARPASRARSGKRKTE